MGIFIVESAAVNNSVQILLQMHSYKGNSQSQIFIFTLLFFFKLVLQIITSTNVRMSDITLPILGNINLNSLSRDITVFANGIFNVPYDLYVFRIPLVHILSQLLPFYYDCCCLLINLQEPILQLCLERISL